MAKKAWKNNNSINKITKVEAIVNFSQSTADLATGRERPMATGGRVYRRLAKS